ncbi:MAG: hypothetical protein IKZ51_08930 [Bacteroidales bacterium]|nr:hypothetical protein [Bacteroidales bacterium]
MIYVIIGAVAAFVLLLLFWDDHDSSYDRGDGRSRFSRKAFDEARTAFNDAMKGTWQKSYWSGSAEDVGLERMKRLYSILMFCCICTTIHAQIPNQNCLKIDLHQTDISYTDDSTRNDYYREFNLNNSDYLFVHNADSSYMVGEVPIPFRLTHAEPSFQGGGPTEFCNWFGKKILDLLENNKEYCFWLTVEFMISSNGRVQDVQVNPYHSDKEQTSLDESILTIIKESPNWTPEHHYWKRYCTPMRLEISSNHFVKEKGTVIFGPYSTYYFHCLSYQLWSDSPEKAQREVIPDYQIASDKDIEERAHLEDNSVNLNQWIKSNIQDITKMEGFEDGESEIELIISANGWVSKATVINSYDPLLGEYLAAMLLKSCPRWVPAKVNGICIPSKIRISYSWQF